MFLGKEKKKREKRSLLVKGGSDVSGVDKLDLFFYLSVVFRCYKVGFDGVEIVFFYGVVFREFL